MQRKRAFWILLLGMALVLTACGGSATSPTGQGTDEGTAPQTQQVLVWGRGGDSVSLDPANVTDGESLKVTIQIFDTLLRFEGDTTNVGPSLAESCQPNQDATVFTCTLRQGVQFQDGTPFNADAVVFNFDRWRKTDNPYRFPGENFAYYEYMFGGFDNDSIIQDVKALDEYTVQFQLKEPLAPFLQNIAMPAFAIASPAAIQAYKESFAQHPVGTGPFTFVSWAPDDRIVLARNDQYWDTPAKLDQLIYRVIPDNGERLLELQAGTIQFADGINPADVSVIKSDPNLQLFIRPANDIGYMAMNMEKKPFDDVRVRLAINYAINKDALVKAFYGDLGQVANTPLPPKMWGHDSDLKYPYDPEKAKQLLAEAGFPNGFETELWAMSNPRPYFPEPQKMAEAIANDLSQVGIKVKLVVYPWSTYLQKTENGEHTMALLGWIGDNGDPDNFLYVLLDKDNAVKGSAGNIAFYKSDSLHDILIRAQRIPDQKERERLYIEAQKIIFNDAPWAPLVYAEDPVAASAKVQGYVASPLGLEQLTQVSLKP